MKKSFTIALSLIVLFSFGQEVEKVNGIDKSDISKIGGVDIGNISKIMGIDISTYNACNGETTILYVGQTYSIVSIGTQCWMAEDLNVGTRINDNIDQSDDFTLEKYCYDNLESNCDIYGGLYQWNEMMQYTTTPGVQGICPSGWHIPTDEEWKQLEGAVDSQYGYPDAEWDVAGLRGMDVGHHLKSTTGWFDNGNGDNSFGFTSLPGGYQYLVAGNYIGLGYVSRLWSSTEDGGSDAWRRQVSSDNSRVYRSSSTKEAGFSARCVKDFVCGNTIEDPRDGQHYGTIQIGNQCWMAENLNVGTRIDGANDQTNNSTLEKYCYDDLESNCDIYGGLYQWDEMMQYTTTPGVQGICPPDWHLPTDEEWKQLEGAVDSQYGYPDVEWDDLGFRGFDAGLNLKSNSGWDAGGNGTDLYGFSALPSGNRYYSGGSFYNMGARALFWSSIEYNSASVFARDLHYDYSEVYRSNYVKEHGFAVRCLQGQIPVY